MMFGRKKNNKKVTLEAAEKAMKDFKALTIESKKIEAEIEEKTNILNEEYADDLKRIGKGIEAATETLKTYTIENEAELLKGKASAKIGGGTISYGKGTQKLALKKGLKWENVLEKVKEFMPKYIRQKSEIDKTQLKKDATTDKIVLENLGKVGVELVRERKFSVKV